MSTKAQRQRGVTLIELIMFIVIIGVALAGLVRVLGMTSVASADPLRQKQALMIAEGLMEEVRLAGFTFCDPTDTALPEAIDSAGCTIKESFGQGSGGEPVGARPFDNVNDYADAAGTAKAAFDVGGVLSDATGDPVGAAGYTAQVTIRPAELNGIGAAGASADTDVLRITIDVSYGGQKLTLDGYRTRFAPNSP